MSNAKLNVYTKIKINVYFVNITKSKEELCNKVKPYKIVYLITKNEHISLESTLNIYGNHSVIEYIISKAKNE